jgi:translation elongation factor EF-G
MNRKGRPKRMKPVLPTQWDLDVAKRADWLREQADEEHRRALDQAREMNAQARRTSSAGVSEKDSELMQRYLAGEVDEHGRELSYKARGTVARSAPTATERPPLKNSADEKAEDVREHRLKCAEAVLALYGEEALTPSDREILGLPGD